MKRDLRDFRPDALRTNFEYYAALMPAMIAAVVAPATVPVPATVPLAATVPSAILVPMTAIMTAPAAAIVI